MDPVISLITLIMAISLAGERLVTLLKTMIPWLADDPNAQKSSTERPEIWRKSVVMLLAFFSCWLTAELVKESVEASAKSEFSKLPAVFLGLLASGGSAFWTSLLGYTKAVRDIKVQQNQQEQINTLQQKSSSTAFQVQRRASQVMSRLSGLKSPLFSDTTTSLINRI